MVLYWKVSQQASRPGVHRLGFLKPNYTPPYSSSFTLTHIPQPQQTYNLISRLIKRKATTRKERQTSSPQRLWVSEWERASVRERERERERGGGECVCVCERERVGVRYEKLWRSCTNRKRKGQPTNQPTSRTNKQERKKERKKETRPKKLIFWLFDKKQNKTKQTNKQTNKQTKTEEEWDTFTKDRLIIT